MHITSAANPRYKSLAALERKKERKEQGVFLAEGLQTLTFALQAGWQPLTLIHTEDEQHPLLKPLLKAAQGVLTMPPSLLSRLTRRENAQTVLATFATRLLPLTELKPASDDIILALDRVRDPGNLGTILRTCDAAGVTKVILIGDCTDPFAPEVVRATMGSLFHTTLYHASEDTFIAWSKKHHATLLGTHLQGTVGFRQLPSLIPPSSPHHPDIIPPSSANKNNPLITLMGTEQTGLSDSLTAACQHLVRIPMAGKLESLNLATATALILYELKRNVL